MKLSIAFLLASLLMAIGGWILTLPNWNAATTPAAIGGLLTGLGGVVVAWLGKSPITPKGGSQ
jgi:hypothetical protein